jgi:hypothetical protein
LGEAVNYTVNMWVKLRRCFDHAEVELCNNVAENSMRPVALGRKKLAACGQRKVRSEGRGDSFGGGILPAAAGSGEGLPARRSAWHEPKKTFRSRSAHSGSLEDVSWSQRPRAKIVMDVQA